MDEKERASKLAVAAPPLNTKELAEINAAFTPYIFRRKKTREIWTTCCGRHEVIPKECTDAQYKVMEAEHEPEARPEPQMCHGWAMSLPERRGRVKTPCPYCGTEAYVKELGRTGNRENLGEWKRVVVYRWYKGALWARAYEVSKVYKGNCPDMAHLTARPACTLHKAYRFKPGEALCAEGHGWRAPLEYVTIEEMLAPPTKLPLRFHEPFYYSQTYGASFEAINQDEILKSPFRYCGHEKFFSHSWAHMRFLALCCHYPRQIEMLMKAGLHEAVKDLAEGRRWNKAAFEWGETNPLASFGLNKNELKDFLAGKKDLETLGYYKQLRRAKVKCTISDVEEAVETAPYGKGKVVVKRLRECRIEPRRWVEYIRREMDTANGAKKRNRVTLHNVAQYWIDYINEAEVLGYDLTNPLMQMPKGLVKKHDAAVKAAEAVREAKRKVELLELAEKAQERNRECDKRYAFAFGGYLIRAPIDAAEIAAEGKALKHCVGGYAERHLNGTLSILFLRSQTDPDKPLVTIEMTGNEIKQIHGYKNDIDAMVKPRQKYAEILDPWLAWLRKGSRRDEDGVPILPRGIEERLAVAV
jgi:hypothetical protein